MLNAVQLSSVMHLLLKIVLDFFSTSHFTTDIVAHASTNWYHYDCDKLSLYICKFFDHQTYIFIRHIIFL